MKTLSLAALVLASTLLLAACSTPPKAPRGIAANNTSPSPAPAVDISATELTQHPPEATARAS
jgi:starvation-inducible outer membrane lipoprotein